MEIVVSANDFLELGLKIAGYKNLRRCNHETLVDRYKKQFGLEPTTCEGLWLDLQRTSNEEGRIDTKTTKPIFLLIGLRWLWTYPTEETLASFFGMDKKTVRKYYKSSVTKIHMLFEKISPPIEEIDDHFVYILSIDGTHCPIQEPKPWSPKWSSHKLGKKAGVAYEVGLRIHKDEIAWVNGPYPAGSNDSTIFDDKLKEKLQTLNDKLTKKKKVRL